jgi:hypothetical protein
MEYISFAPTSPDYEMYDEYIGTVKPFLEPEPDTEPLPFDIEKQVPEWSTK